jgi:polysaccharide export outer membrane protein
VKKNNYFKIQVNRLVIYFLMLALVSSCSNRNLVYLSDLSASTSNDAPIKNYSQPKIQPDDLLNITVSSLNAESNVLFNNVILPSNANAGNTIASKVNEGYLVDKSGAINFPVIGKIMLVGLTKEQATEKLTTEIKAHVKNPIVNIRFMNFKVTVIGEVNGPATFIIATEKISVLEALGLAGDMTVFAKRENVLIIREQDGIRRTVRINLNNKDVLNSPYYYLQQNDIVYVEPVNKAKLAETQQNNRLIPIWTTILSTAAFVTVTILYNN